MLASVAGAVVARRRWITKNCLILCGHMVGDEGSSECHCELKVLSVRFVNVLKRQIFFNTIRIF
jgi:hypothetical protein